MLSNQDIKKVTLKLLQEGFVKYFAKPKKETRHIILDRLFPSPRRITSTMSGLQTSLGTFWEKLSIKLAQQNGFKVLENNMLEQPFSIPNELSTLIAHYKKEREDNGGELTEFKTKLNKLYPLADNPDKKYKQMTKGKGSDVILTKNNNVYLFDIKTVQVNANSGNSFNETLILWTAYFKYRYGTSATNIHSRLAFPYNSANEKNDGAWWNDFGSRVAPLTKKDVLVGNEFWEFLTDNPGALSAIISALDELANDSEFIDLYKQVFECEGYDDLVQFSENVKLDKIRRKFTIEILEHESPLNLSKKHEWKHGLDDCTFKERVNKLLNDDAYKCPTCKNKL